MNKKSLILSISMILLVALLGGWLVFRGQGDVQNVPKEPSVASEQPVQTMENPQEVPTAVLDANFAKYNKVLSRDKITGVKDLEGPYKKVTVSNGEVTFSFEIPDKWLVETRNSGEVTMNEEELREFLGTNYDGDIREGYSCKEVPTIDCRGSDDCSDGIPGMQRLCGEPTGDYWDFTWDMLKDMPYSEMKGYYDKKRDEFSSGFPNATVTSDNKIWYTDIGWDQVNFYILDKTSDSQYIKGVTSFCYDAKCLQKDYLEYRENIKKEAKRDGNGDVIVDKGEMHGFAEMIDFGNNTVLRIWKEAYVEGDFEKGFQHIIETLEFE